ncbi:MAG: bifunctional 5,10-methylene-tetrahydrofolate dehydrogenase/5,10-methylene-tetrahydrofolate cyclohydrolase, partial [Burkholderiales bacterium]|nr:bifunctional 5,10-methylene-tetrahydrofolate dehydrogenase/5,10-methylene-tetrahydrofolate cyclohydrolase [Burkholderiales bacterium]
MPAKIIDGVAHARAMRADIKSEIEILTARGSQPGLAVLLVGDDPASQVYIRNKQKACVESGFHSEVHHLAAETSQAELLERIESLNDNPKIHGILVQLPLPKHIDAREIIESISPAKDVDCFHPYNVGRMALGEDTLYPCTPHGVMRLLQREGIE